MKENYMIGDWVRNDLGEVQRIVELRETGAMLSYNDIYGYDEIEPVPLTKKILEKNGFDNYGESWYLPCDDVSVSVGFYMYKTTIHVKKGDDVFQKEVRCDYRACAENRRVYIHTLQQAIRIAGIDMEIEL